MLLRIMLTFIALILISLTLAEKKHMAISQDNEDAWQKLVNPLSSCEEVCLKTCCRDGGGQDCIDACGCNGRSCPQGTPQKQFNLLVKPLSARGPSCGSKCQTAGDCYGAGFCTDCFGGLCRNDLQNATATGALTVYLIRHGEKKHGCGGCKGCLSHQGKERAENLSKIFNGGRFSTPKGLFAYHYGLTHGNTNCERCKEMLTPISEHLKENIEFNYGPQPTPAAAAMMKVLKASGGPVLAAWEHNHIHDLAESLGAKDVPTWEESDYDSVYVLTFDSAFKLTSFEHSHEGFKPKL